MVAERAEGNRRIYHLQDGGMRAVQDYLEGVWGDAAARFRLLAENTAPPAMTAPLRITFDVDCPPQHAFTVWTSKIGDLVAAGSHGERESRQRSSSRAAQGGRIYERTSAGERHEWGEVTVWEPPRRLAYLWHLGRDRCRGHRGRDHLRRRRATPARASRSSTAGGRRWATRRTPGGTRTAPAGMHCCRTSRRR